MYLCIDTISQAAGIILVSQKKVAYISLDPHHASEGILKAIDKLIKEMGITTSDLEGVFVIKGPGSFTGLRVGLSVANQFAHQLSIPIIGLTTDEWWSGRTDEKDFVYLQTMNRSEVYRVKGPEAKIIPIDELKGEAKWLGDLSEDHQKKLPSKFCELKELRATKETWQKIIQNFPQKNISQKMYNLIEPFYGKEPTITKSKRYQI